MRRLALALAGCLGVWPCGTQQPALAGPPVAGSHFVSTKYGFSIDVPRGWLGGTWATDLPIFANFPWSRLQGQEDVPKGGAMIRILAQEILHGRHHNYSLDQWAESDERAASGETASSRELEMPKESGVSRAIIVAFDERTHCPSEQQRGHITVYWQMGARRFAAYMDYLVGDPKANKYEDLLISVVRGIQPP